MTPSDPSDPVTPPPADDATRPGAPPTRLPTAPRVRAVKIGDVIADTYRITRFLGRGGMGLVVAATHVTLGQTVALKFLTPGTDEDGPEAHSRFLREARITVRLRSPHVVRTLDYGVLDDGTQFMVMECLEGIDLGQVLAADELLPIEVAVDYVVQACQGLAEAHALGAVHRDLKPGNLFLTRDLEGQPLVKVLDFGVSKAGVMVDPESVGNPITVAGTMLGSPRYMSPEQLRNAPDVDQRSDVWALAVILYELLTGQPPFRGAAPAITCALILGEDPPLAPSRRRPGIPPALDAAVLRALTRDLDARTPDVGELASDLLRAIGLPEGPVSLRIAATLERGPASRRAPSERPLASTGDELHDARAESASPETASPSSASASGPGPAILLGIAIGLCAVVLWFALRPAEPAPADPGSPAVVTVASGAPSAAAVASAGSVPTSEVRSAASAAPTAASSVPATAAMSAGTPTRPRAPALPIATPPAAASSAPAPPPPPRSTAGVLDERH